MNLAKPLEIEFIFKNQLCSSVFEFTVIRH